MKLLLRLWKIKFFLLALLFSKIIFADTILKEIYYIQNNEIKISDIVTDFKSDIVLYTIFDGRYTKRVKSKELISLLQKYGYKNFTTKKKYIKFIKEKKIDFSYIKNKLKNLYKVNYQNIVFKNIEIHSRGYLNSLPTQYNLKINSKNYLKSNGILSIKDKKTKKQIFFDYTIDADVNVYLSKKNIRRKEELSFKNCSKKTIHFDRFRAMPIQKIDKKSIQSKHNIKENTIITVRDIQKFNLIRRGSTINVVLKNRNISISFSAVSLQDGLYGDIIKVKQNNSKIIKVKVIGYDLGKVI